MSLEENMVAACLQRAIDEFHSNPLSAQLMRRLATKESITFAPVAASMLLSAGEGPGFRYLALLLVKQPSLFKQLSNPLTFSKQQAINLSKRLMGVDPSLDIRFARQLPARNGNTPDTIQGQAAERALDILDEISLGKRVVAVLSHLTRHVDHKISSKATLLVGKRVQDVAFSKRLIMEETDPRVRANAIEAIWGNDSPPVQQLFWDCVKDRHNRVVGNAMVGLYLAGEEKINEVVTGFAHDYKSDFRMTSAWTMGRMGNADFLPTLSPLIKDQHPGVRSAALRSLQNIRQVEKMRRPSETDLEIDLPSAEIAAAQIPASVLSRNVPEQVPVAAPMMNVEIHLDGSRRGR